MADSPNYSFNRNPRFSVNHVADYLCATSAGQRETVIRSAKFPRKPAVIPYSQAKRIISNFLIGNTGTVSALDDDIRRLETRYRREPDGWMRDELKRNLDAIEAFKQTFTRGRARRYSFGAGPIDVPLNIEGVKINARLDASVTEMSNEVTYSGGCVLFIANTDQARKNVDERRKSVAALIYWALSEGNIEPLPRLCMSLDVFGMEIVKASSSIDRFRSNVQSSCREVAGNWDRIRPPSGYDGPDWRRLS